jgi:serine/threonine protein phosphatase PrpC
MGTPTGPGDLYPVYEATLGCAVACSRRGASHRRAGVPCQDACVVWPGSAGGEPCLVLAVADGHGDERHDLSHQGAALAVKSAVDQLLAVFAPFGPQGSRSSLAANFKADFPRRVGRQWREAVLADAHRRCGGPAPGPEEAPATLTRYGTTLLAALVVPEAVLLAQIGDGEALLVGPDRAVEAPFHKDPGLVGTETHSLSTPEAHLLWQTAALERRDGALLVLATDGLTDAFEGGPGEGREFHRFAESLLGRIGEFGIQPVAASIPAWLDGYSERVTGDDVTLALAYLTRPRVADPDAQAAPEGGSNGHPAQGG